MPIRLLFIACYALRLAEANWPPSTSDPGLKEIEGLWRVAAMTFDGHVVPAAGLKGAQVFCGGNQLTYTFTVNGRPINVLFKVTVDAAKTPHYIDAQLLTGNLKGGLCRGICTVTENTMTLCLPDNPNVPRPRALRSDPGSNLHLLKLERVHD